MSGIGDNSSLPSYAADMLRSYVERIERLEEEARAINSDKSDVYTEAKSNGYDAKVLKRIVAWRRKDADKRDEEETIFDLYRAALGMIPDNRGTPVATRARTKTAPVAASATPPHDPDTGEIIDDRAMPSAKEIGPDSSVGVASEVMPAADEIAETGIPVSAEVDTRAASPSPPSPARSPCSTAPAGRSAERLPALARSPTRSTSAGSSTPATFQNPSGGPDDGRSDHACRGDQVPTRERQVHDRR